MENFKAVKLQYIHLLITVKVRQIRSLLCLSPKKAQFCHPRWFHCEENCHIWHFSRPCPTGRWGTGERWVGKMKPNPNLALRSHERWMYGSISSLTWKCHWYQLAGKQKAPALACGRLAPPRTGQPAGHACVSLLFMTWTLVLPVACSHTSSWLGATSCLCHIGKEEICFPACRSETLFCAE